MTGLFPCGALLDLHKIWMLWFNLQDWTSRWRRLLLTGSCRRSEPV